MRVEASLLATGVSWMTVMIAGYLASGQLPRRMGTAMSITAPYELFRASDGAVFIAAGNDRLFAKVCEALGCTELLADPRFATNNERVKNRDVLIPQLSALTPARTTAAWITALEAADIPCAPVNDLATAFSELAENSPGMVQTVQHPRAGELHQLGVPFKFGSCEGNIRRPPPMLGEHTEEILKGVLGKTAEEIDFLRQKKAIDAAA